MSNLTDNLYALDIETGGLDVGVPVIEVAYGPVFQDSLSVLWNTDAKEEDCTEEALALNKCFWPYRPHAPQELRVDEHALACIVADELKDKVIIAQNPEFDTRHLEALLKRHGFARPWSYRLLNLSTLVVGWISRDRLKAPEMPKRGWGQATAAELMGIKPVDTDLAHTAAGDVLNLREIARKVFGEPDAWKRP